jgi:hypothetical protein
MKLLINSLEGASAFSSSEMRIVSIIKDKITILVNEKKISINDCAILDHNSLVYSKRSNIDDIKKYFSKETNCLFIGKSFGGVRTFELLDVILKNRLIDFDKDNKIIVFFIDAHGDSNNESILPYGRFMKINVPPFWKKEYNIKIINYYQRKAYPYGAEIIGADTSEEITGADHFTIIHNEIIKNAVKEAIISLI